jgi:hypothetical protein
MNESIEEHHRRIELRGIELIRQDRRDPAKAAHRILDHGFY